MNEYEVVDVNEAGIDITVPADGESASEWAERMAGLQAEADSYVEAVKAAEEPLVEEEPEEEEQARPNRAVIRRARRVARLHGAGWTRPYRKGRESKP